MIRTYLTTARIAASIAILGLLMTNLAAAHTVYPVQGDSGDAGFQDRCPANQYLIGLAGRTGNVVDQIQIICSPIMPNGTHGTTYYGPSRGGTGGAAQEFSCASDSYATGAVLYEDDNLRRMTRVDLTCTSLQNVRTGTVSLASTSQDYMAGVPTPQPCPNGELADGFAGRYGRNVNALGLYCDARTTVSAPTPAPVLVPSNAGDPIRTTGAGPDSTLGGSAGCPKGLVWREASPTDHVCVNIGQHLLTLQENKAAASHVSQTDHTYGPNTCASGYVWRGAYSGDVVCVTPDIRQMVSDENKYAASLKTSAPTTALACLQGYVWREASPTDHVCVTPIVRTITAAENKDAASHLSQTDHTYGPNTCAQGYVWRQAFPGDAVCVTPHDRQAAADQNKIAPPMI